MKAGKKGKKVQRTTNQSTLSPKIEGWVVLPEWGRLMVPPEKLRKEPKRKKNKIEAKMNGN